MALAIVLLAGAGVMIRSFPEYLLRRTWASTRPISSDGAVDAAGGEVSTAEARIAFFDRLEARLEAIPGVESIAIGRPLPRGGRRAPVRACRRSARRRAAPPEALGVMISPAYFRTLGASVLSGREFNDADGVGCRCDRESAVREPVLAGRRSARQRLRLFDGQDAGAWLTVVGVVSNIIQNDATRQEFDPVVYLPYRQSRAEHVGFRANPRRFRRSPTPSGVRSRRSIPICRCRPDEIAERMERSGTAGSTDRVPDLCGHRAAARLDRPVYRHRAFGEPAHAGDRRSDGGWRRRARHSRARLSTGTAATGLGLTIGLAASFAVNRVLAAALVQVSPADPISLAVASAALVVSASLGCLIPARRAMRLDPVVALRHQ